LPENVEVWHLNEKRIFRVATQLAPGSRCLLALAKYDRDEAHQAIATLHGLITSMASSKTKRLNQKICSKNIFFSPQCGKVTLVDWSDATQGSSRLPVSAINAVKAYYGSSKAMGLLMEHYALMWCLADVGEVAYFRHNKSKLRALPSMMMDRGPSSRQLCLKKLSAHERLGSIKAQLIGSVKRSYGFGELLRISC
jgi:hypothetical protein